jgi:hypothetical protein
VGGAGQLAVVGGGALSGRAKLVVGGGHVLLRIGESLTGAIFFARAQPEHCL